MKKFFYLTASLLLILSASSCSKKCVQCQATDKFGVVVNTSNSVCEHDFNRGHFEDNYKENFKEYNPVCVESSN